MATESKIYKQQVESWAFLFFLLKVSQVAFSDSCCASNKLSEHLMDQEQTVLYEPLGELREAVRNAMNLGDRNTFPIIFLPAGPTLLLCSQTDTLKVQDQCNSKCCSSLPPCIQLSPRGSASPPSLGTSQDNVTLFILGKAPLLRDVAKTRQHQLALNSADSPPMPETRRWGALCWKS